MNRLDYEVKGQGHNKTKYYFLTLKWETYLTNCLWKLRQIYNLCADWDKD